MGGNHRDRASTALGLNRHFVTLWVGPDKTGSIVFNIALCASAILATRTTLITLILSGLGVIELTAWATFAELVVRVPLMMLGLRVLGLSGVPIAVLAGAGILNFWWLPRLLNLRLKLAGKQGYLLQAVGIYAPTCTFVLASIATFVLPPPRNWVSLLAEALVLVVMNVSVTIASSRAVRQMAVSGIVKLRARYLRTATSK